MYKQIQQRRKEVKAKAIEVEAQRHATRNEKPWETQGWNQSSSYSFGQSADPLEEQFRRWETEDELERMKRNMGR